MGENRKRRHCKATAIIMHVSSGSMYAEFEISSLGIEGNLHKDNIGVPLPVDAAYYKTVRRCKYSCI